MKHKFSEMTAEELQNQLKTLKADLFHLRFQQATGSLSNPMQIRECRRNIARVQTLIRQHEMQAVQA